MKRNEGGVVYHRSFLAQVHFASFCLKLLFGGSCLFLVIVPFFFGAAPVFAAPVQNKQISLAQHALLVASQPAADAILHAPPNAVHMWFSETLIPATSKALVVDTTNRQVDLNDNHVNANNGEEMDLTLPLLPAGTYVVVWQTQSAIDGHVARGSFLFRIARPDGSVPPIPSVLPTGHVPGAGGLGAQSGNTLDGPTLFQTISTWLALFLLTFWVGGIIWETWIFAPHENHASGSPSAFAQASRRLRTYTYYALIGIMIADIGIIIGQAAELAGSWSGSISLPLLQAILFESHFGMLWWLWEGVTLFALFFLWITRDYAVPEQDDQGLEDENSAHSINFSLDHIQDALLREVASFVHVLRGILHLPGHLISGVHKRSWYGRIECLLGFALFSGLCAVRTCGGRYLLGRMGYYQY